MRLRQTMIVAGLVVFGWVAVAGLAYADYSWPYVLPDTASDILYGKTGKVTAGEVLFGDIDDVVDGLVLEFTDPPSDDNDLFFYSDGPNGEFELRQFIINGLNHNLTSLRVWSAIDVPPETVRVLANSTDTLDPTDSGWTELIALTTLTDTWSTDLPAEEPNVALYRDFAVSASGVKSLLFEFSNPSVDNFIRICEIQAYGQAVPSEEVVPEPSAMITAVMGIVGLSAYVWRKRK